MNEVIDFEILEGYKIKLSFQDGYSGIVDIRPMIGEGFTKELLQQEEFNKVQIEPGGGLVWPNGFDICPNHLRNLASSEVFETQAKQ